MGWKGVGRMTVREQAKRIFDHEVVGKLKRMPEGNYEKDFGLRWYTDEVGAEYYVQKNDNKLVWITTSLGGVM